MEKVIVGDNFKSTVFEYTKGITIPNSINPRALADFYKTNALIYTLINFKAMKASQIKPILFKVNDKAKAKQYEKLKLKENKGFELSVKEADSMLKLKEEAYTEVDLDSISDISPLYRIKKLLKKPNDWQSFGEWIYSLSAFQDISGWACAYKVLNSLKLPMRVYSLPTHRLQIKSKSPFHPVEGYIYDYLATVINFKEEECISMRTFSVDYDKFGGHLYGTSKIATALAELNTYKAAQKREYISSDTGDSVHVLFPKQQEHQIGLEEGRTALQKLSDYITGSFRKKDQHQSAVVGIEMGSINLASQMTQDLTKNIKNDAKEVLSSVWGLPYRLVFNSSESATYNNVNEDRKAALHNSVFPFLIQVEEHLNDIFGVPAEYKLCFDFDVYPELEADMVESMAKMKDIDFLTRNEKRFNYQYEKIDNWDFEDMGVDISEEDL